MCYRCTPEESAKLVMLPAKWVIKSCTKIFLFLEELDFLPLTCLTLLMGEWVLIPPYLNLVAKFERFGFEIR